ncbi:MBL fold metallo-hydrolase [Oceanobacillus jeddahense]|uniref:MBL fold metallo-hydrolase n=1 Tax=Oceanobacillus jeddahense TaxID=1462527 RepID=A0ABY5JR28_9BACI|nr:MBL fold metallo-hydrolase [Oceanobacillus jeddahense]UUI02239.1 MBL fold metallo-hydrolase [Oceanobacillus jeddahense]
MIAKKEVTPMLDKLGMKRITLSLPFRLNHVNCFIAEEADGYKILDAGLHNEDTAKVWEKELAGKRVTDIIVSHYHPDHFGYAGKLQEKTNARVWMPEIDLQAALQAWEKPFLEKLKANYHRAGIPEDISGALAENTAAFAPLVTPYPKVENILKEGETLQFGKYAYEIIHTPGHSDGLVTFYNRENNVLLSTDHILPKITPNISYWFHGDSNPLENYLHSLKKIKKLDVEWVIPSHGDPFQNASKRISEIEAHHAERLSSLKEMLKTRLTVYETMEKLFPKKLAVHDTRFAVGETLAHLEYLRLAGECGRELVDGIYIYHVIS